MDFKQTIFSTMFLQGFLLFIILLRSIHASRLTNCQQKQTSVMQACSPPWLAFRNHCYLYVIEKKKFLDAEQHCTEFSTPTRPAHLVSIADSEEQDFLFHYARAIYGQNYWIGYTDMAHNGKFVWTDGSSGNFGKWNGGEPNNSEGPKNCAFVKTINVWDDVGCHRKYSFICKMMM